MPSQKVHHRKSRIADPVLPDQASHAMPVDPVGINHIPQDELIRRKAFEIYEQRGRERGRELDDWLAAEAQVRVRSAY